MDWCTDVKELFYRGCSLLDAGEPAQAIEHLAKAAARAPDTAAIMERLAEAYHLSGQLLPALKTYDRLIERGAATHATWCATGNTLSDAGEHAQAIGAFEHSLELNATNPEAHHNLARAHYRMGNLSGAIDHLKIAAAQGESIDPWLSLATIIPGWPDATHEAILDVRRAFAARLKAYAPAPFSSRVSRRMSTTSRLRIGYMSAFFDQANYMKPVWGLINNHDRESFDIHLLSDCPLSRLDGYIGHSRDRIHETGKLNNDAITELIQSSGIDILVDLNAYSAPDRLPLFAQRQAPVTIAWFNMYATSGLPGIDCIVGDHEVIRMQEERFYSEKVSRLPVSYLTFKVTHAAPPVVEPPCRRDSGFVFGSLVAQYKINGPVIRAWSEILSRAPNTRLLLANAQLRSPQNCRWVLKQFGKYGVDSDRLVLMPPADHYAYLKYYNAIDIALDAFPYNGGTTTMEAMWQGVPVLTFDGDRWASRTSQSLIRRTHLGEFVTRDIQSYVETAVKIAKDPNTPSRLLEVRKNMRRNLEKTSACDTQALARSMQQLYQNLWQNRESAA